MKDAHRSRGKGYLASISRFILAFLILFIPAARPTSIAQESDPEVLTVPSGEKYYEHRLIWVTVPDSSAMKLLHTITGDGWFRPLKDHQVEVVLAPEAFDRLAETPLEYEIRVQDAGKYIDARSRELLRNLGRSDLGWFEEYQPFAEIQNRIEELALVYSGMTWHTVLGHSIYGHDIDMLMVTGPGIYYERPAILILGCQHAREWISPMTVLYCCQQLLEQYATSPRVRNILDHSKFFFVPVANPDGYLYTWSDTGDRYWRKNYNPNPGWNCRGVDLNRNWGYHWGEGNVDPNPCVNGNNNTWPGESAFSEPETQAIASFALAHQDEIQGLIDMHSFGQFVMRPWVYTEDPPPYLSAYDYLGGVITDAIFGVHGKIYEYGASHELLPFGVYGGASKDWGMGTLGALSWTIELRPTYWDHGLEGFWPPPEEILPTGEENYEALLQFAESLLPPLSVWVDFNYQGTERGTFSNPYNTVSEGCNAVLEYGQVLMKAGTSGETLTISNALTLRSYAGAAIIGHESHLLGDDGAAGEEESTFHGER